VALTSLFPLIAAALINLVAVPVYFYRTERGWAAWRAALDRRGMRYFATGMLLCHTYISVTLFSHFNCVGPFEDDAGRPRRHLATDYAITCDSSEYVLFSYYAGLMLAFYVALLPAGVLLWLKANRSGQLSPRELAAKDGVLASLTARYSPQFWWFEAADVLMRLSFCGLANAVFPSSLVLRTALCLIMVTAHMLFLVAYELVLLASSRRVRLLSGALLFLLGLGALITTHGASTSVQIGYSVGLSLFVLGTGAILWYLKSKEPQYALVAAINAGEAFDLDMFGDGQSGSFMYDVVARRARDIARAPTAKGMAYLRAQLLPLAKVWAEKHPAALVLRDREDVVEDRLAALNKTAPLAAQLEALFDDVVDYRSAFLAV